MNTLPFIAGLPRSGSTLLSALLRQNRRIAAGISSPVASLFEALHVAMGVHRDYGLVIDNAQRHQVLLADEPVASLDPEAADDIMRLLRHLATHEHLAVLCVLHQVELAYAYADRVVGIRDGRIAFDRPCAELPRDAVRQLYLNEAA